MLSNNSTSRLVRRLTAGFLALAAMLLSVCVFAASADSGQAFDLTSHWAGYMALGIFIITYVLIIFEESIHLKKSKPTIVAAGFIWILVAVAYIQQGETQLAEQLLEHNLLEFVELFLFLLAAMTFINTMEERGVFNALRVKLVSQGFSFRQIFWITGLLAFMISPLADNLTTALLMTAVVTAVGGGNTKFVAIGCINIVVAANAGGVFSPFGDITTLMVWQANKVEALQFLLLIIPSLANWLVPAIIMSFAVPDAKPAPIKEEASIRLGGLIVVGLFLVTILMAVSFHSILHLPPVLGMMTGLGFLKLFGYYLQQRDTTYMGSDKARTEVSGDAALFDESAHEDADYTGGGERYDIFKNLQRAEWDTLMFFYGIILCVGGLGAFGYLAMTSEFLYVDIGPTTANIIVGFASALIDNIPVMFAVLEMNPELDLGQWLLVTLTAGVGGSMLSIGSAAGVAVMGQARGVYTFFAHLKWSWAILLGYIVSIGLHFLINGDTFI